LRLCKPAWQGENREELSLKTKKIFGKCKLCRKDRELRNSHYLPSAVYKVNLARKLKNPNPVVIAGGEAKQVSDQIKGYVLCSDCEQCFSKHGEKWVLANIPRDYKEPCPLQDALGPEMPITSTGKLDLYAGEKIKAFDMEKLVYFAVSVFWRGAINKWKSTLGKIPPPVDLGAYEELIRKFLLKESFPDDVVLVVSVYRWKPALNALCPVIPDHLPECQRYWFYIPGM
jgi:hypothetical protein